MISMLIASAIALLSFTPSAALDRLEAEHPSFRWSKERVVAAQLRASGSAGAAALGVGDTSLLLVVETPGAERTNVEIPADASRQFGVCGLLDATLDTQGTSERPYNATGEYPDGYSLCDACVELVVYGGECDPIYFYWNHKSGSLDWWRP